MYFNNEQNHSLLQAGFASQEEIERLTKPTWLDKLGREGIVILLLALPLLIVIVTLFAYWR